MNAFKALSFTGLAWLLVVLVAVPVARAQDDPVTVPDVTGLSVPQAAAVLNQNGLALGSQSSEPWSEAAGQPANTVLNQSVVPGMTVERGTAIDVGVLRAPNMLLVYDAESITLINQNDSPVSLRGLVFTAVDGNTPASFAATDWTGALDGGQRCAQLWAVRRTGPERPPECAGVQRWLSTVNAGVHFWTGANGVSAFRVVYDGVEYATCDAASVGAGRKQCAFYLPADAESSANTPYIYFVYTTDQLLVLNQSTDQWMPVAQTVVYNYNPNISIPGANVDIGDPGLFGNPATVADIGRLAPGQCLWFTNSSPEIAAPPQECDAIARLDIAPQFIFWAADFELESVTDGLRHTCPAATPGKLTVCVMPR